MTATRAISTLAALVCAAALAACSGTEESGPAGGREFIAASLAPVTVQVREAPPAEPAFSRTMFAAATLSDYTPPLDACQGPVAIDVETDGRPILVSEHDYCGGAAWIPDLAEGDVVELDGPGLEAGRYDVKVVDTHQRRDVYVSDLRPEMDVVLQTCISQSQLILVGLTKSDDAADV